MKYKVIDTFRIGADTSVTIDGLVKDLKSGTQLTDETGETHMVKSVAMVHGLNRPEDTTTLLVAGEFNGTELSV